MSLNPPILVEIFEGTWWEAGLVKTLLEDAQIEVYQKDSIHGASAFNHITPGRGGVKLMISSDDYSAAKEIIKVYELNQKKLSE